MGIMTLFKNFIRSIQTLWGCFLAFSLRSKKSQVSRDLEAGIPSSRSSFDDTNDAYSNVREIGILEGMGSPDTTSDRSQPLTPELPESPILSRVSSVYPVKARIVDVITKNVHDKRTGIVKFVITTPPSARRRSCRVQIEHLDPSVIKTIKSSVKVINASRYATQVAILPTFLPTTQGTRTIYGPSDSGNSIYDLFDLFPPPPSPTLPRTPNIFHPRIEEPFSTQLETASSRPSSTEQAVPSKSSSLGILNLTGASRDTLFDSGLSIDTAATSPPATPDLIQTTPPGCRKSTDSTISLASRPSKRFKPVIVNGTVYQCSRRNGSQSSSITESLPAEDTLLPVDVSPLTLSPEVVHISRSVGSELSDTCQPCSVSHLPTNQEARIDFAELFEASLASLHAAYLAAMAATLDVETSNAVGIASQNLSLHDTELEDHPLPLDDTLSVNNDANPSAWPGSFQEVLEEFRRAQIEDQDFRDLLGRDSSCYSKSCYSRSSFGSAYTSVAASPSMMHVLKRGMSGKRGSFHTVSSRRWGSPKLTFMSLAEKARLRKEVCSNGSDDAVEEYLETFAELLVR